MAVMSQLEQLKTMTTVVADTGDVAAIKRLEPVDATTNPSLILKAAQMPEYQPLIQAALAKVTAVDAAARIEEGMDRIAVEIGAEIVALVPGRVSIEVDARLSFDTDATVTKARHIVAYFAEKGIGKDRLLIKIAATWEGIRAAEMLEKEGINTNLTLIFSFAQARASAEAGAFLISPFVGRILDWYKKNDPDADHRGVNDPGVKSVSAIFDYFKTHGFKTVVMGASFRGVDEIQNLAGCDRLTISPALLDELANNQDELPRMLTDLGSSKHPEPALTEAKFRWALNADAMATEKLAEGIRGFTADQLKLEAIISEML